MPRLIPGPVSYGPRSLEDVNRTWDQLTRT